MVACSVASSHGSVVLTSLESQADTAGQTPAAGSPCRRVGASALRVLPGVQQRRPGQVFLPHLHTVRVPAVGVYEASVVDAIQAGERSRSPASGKESR